MANPLLRASRALTRHGPESPQYKWVALSNTTIGMLVATINSSIVLISLPAIFRGIHLDPLTPSNVSYLLWMLLGYLVVTAVLVVSFGRLGDMYGRVRMYNLGFAVFTVGSIALALVPGTGGSAALALIALRIVQGVGGALLMANATAILTDAFPSGERGFAMGINQVAAIAGSFIGLVLGGLLAEVDWRLVFWVSVPVGVVGTIWAYHSLHDVGTRRPARMDWWGNLTFGVGLIALLIGITYGIQPYGGHTMGWTSPFVLACMLGGVALLAAFVAVELRVAEPMMDLRLFRIRPFVTGNGASLLSAMSRGGLQFMLIIWLQGIWLPLHGYSFASTPLWAGIYLLPLTGGFLLAGPASGWLSDRFGARPFATAGMLLTAASFIGLMLLPANFSYAWFALLIAVNGIGMGMFSSPNTAQVMNAVPAERRGAANGIRATFMNSGMVLSIGMFFSLLIIGLASALPATMRADLTTAGVPAAQAARIATLPPVGSVFAAFLGYNPIRQLLGPTLGQVPAAQAAHLTSKSFFPGLVSVPFLHGLQIVFGASLLFCLLAALLSVLSGGRFVYGEEPIRSAGAEPARARP